MRLAFAFAFAFARSPGDLLGARRGGSGDDAQILEFVAVPLHEDRVVVLGGSVGDGVASFLVVGGVGVGGRCVLNDGLSLD